MNLEDDFIEAYGKGRLGLSSNTINRILQKIQLIQPEWMRLIDRSFLTQDQKDSYKAIINERLARFF